MLYRKWEIKQLNKNTVDQLSTQLNVDSILSKVLVSKGIESKQQAQITYLDYQELSDPFLIKDMEKAVQRIHQAVENEEKIVVYGDYDVDGVCATAVLFSYLDNMGANVFFKLPNRETEGYGLNKDVLQKLRDKGVSLVVTVDNGISAIDEIDFANSIGLDVIVTDHHLPKSKIPNAYAVVDPLRSDDDSPFKKLAGVGVAFKLVCALEGAYCEEMLEYYSDLVCVGTIADLMLLEGENRTIVKAGLELLNQDSRMGFTSLMQVCGMLGKEITSETIAYTIAPRINAAGRMGDATTALELLLSDEQESSMELANLLEKENQKRQETQNKMAEDITLEILKDQSLINDRVIVVWDDNFHPGVIGIVASRLVERYAKPAIVLTLDGDEYKGSGRSVTAFSLHNALEHTKQHLIRYGGHELAAGLAVEKDKLDDFRKAINDFANQNEEMSRTQPLEIDCKLDLKEITQKSVSEISYLAPFGNGNENPLFMIENAQIIGIYPVSDGKYTRIKVKQDENVLQGIMFSLSPCEFAYKVGNFIDIALALSIYQSDNGKMVSARIKEVRPSQLTDKTIDEYDIYKLFKNNFKLSDDKKAVLYPDRQETALIYRYIKTEKVNCDDLRPLFIKFNNLSSGKIQVIIDVLLDLNLIGIENDKEQNYFKIIPTENKIDLGSSEILKALQ